MKDRGDDNKMYVLMITSIAFALFIVCPRMAGVKVASTSSGLVQ